MKTKLSKKTIILRALMLLLTVSLAATSAVLGYTRKNYIEEQRIYYPATVKKEISSQVLRSIRVLQAETAEGADSGTLDTTRQRILKGEYDPYLPDMCSLIVAGEYITDRSELTEDDVINGRHFFDRNSSVYKNYAAVSVEQYSLDISFQIRNLPVDFFTGYFHPAEFRVDEVIRGNGVEPGDIIKIELGLSSNLPVGGARDRAVLLLDEEGSHVYPGAYCATDLFSFWLTDDNIVLSKVSGIPGQEKYSEMSLERFKTEINRELDAKIEEQAQVEASRAASSAAITAD